MNSGSTPNISNIKTDYDVSNLNFKSLRNLTKKGGLNNLTLPMDNNVDISPKSKKLKKKNFKSYSQNHFGPDYEADNYSREETFGNVNMHLNFASNSSNYSNLNKHNNSANKLLPDYEDIHDTNTLKLIIKNLDNEIREKNDEIKVLNKNFKGKIRLIEQENKKSLDHLESKYKFQLYSATQNHKHLMNDIKQENLNTIANYEEVINKILNEYNDYKSQSIHLSSHNQKINEVNLIWKEHNDKMKKEFENKIKEISQNLDNPMNRSLLEKMQFFGTHIKKFEDILKVKFKEEKGKDIKNYEINELYAYLDKIKINTLETNAEFLKEMAEIQINFESNFSNLNFRENNKLEKLKEVVKKKFSEIEGMSTFADDTNSINKIDISNFANVSNVSNVANFYNKNEETTTLKDIKFKSGFLNNKLNNINKYDNKFISGTFF